MGQHHLQVEPIEAAIRCRLAAGAYDTIVEPSALGEALTGLEHVIKSGVGLLLALSGSLRW